MFAVKVTGPRSDKWSGYAVRNGLDRHGNVLVGITKLANAEKSHTSEEADELAFLLTIQQSHLIGRIRVIQVELKNQEAQCTP